MFPLETSSPDGSQMAPRGGPTPGGLEKERRKTFYTLAKFILMCIAFLVAYYFQVTDDYPLKIDVEETDDPVDPKGRGGGYTCGCDLPITDQSLNYIRDKERSSALNMNRCYDPSELKDMNILMYSNSSAEQVESIQGISSTATRMVEGFKVEQQAHAVTGPLNTLVEYSPSKELNLQSLYPGFERELDWGMNISYFTDGSWAGFPVDYLRLAFSYCCTDVGCGLERVTETFATVLGFTRWGDCFLLDDSINECDRRSYSYQAKCTMYSTASFPSFPVVKRFLTELKKISNIQNITAAQTWDMGWSTPVELSLQPSTIYVNHSTVRRSEVLLRFTHVDPQSAHWLVLAGLFPSVNFPCFSNFTNFTNSMNSTKFTDSTINICTDASLCNLFRDGGLRSIKCLDETVLRNASFCKTVFEKSNLENDGQLCEDLGVASTPQAGSPCTCMMKRECIETLPYLVTWNISESRKDEPTNAFLYRYFLQSAWAELSSPCGNQYQQVIPYNPGAGDDIAKESEYGKETLILQGNCSEEFSRAWKGTGSGRYCWLTGKYRSFTDTPDEEWKQLNIKEFYTDPKSKGRFVCFRIRRERTLVWVILIFGVAFGWAGSVDLIFHLIERLRTECEELKKKKAQAGQVTVQIDHLRALPVRTTSY